MNIEEYRIHVTCDFNSPDDDGYKRGYGCYTESFPSTEFMSYTTDMNIVLLLHLCIDQIPLELGNTNGEQKDLYITVSNECGWEHEVFIDRWKIAMSIMEDWSNGFRLKNSMSFSFSYTKRTATYAKTKSQGYVYLMRDHRNDFIKIGYSKNPKYREKTLQSEQPLIELICFGKGTMNNEKSLHSEYSEFRVRGEWFKLDEKQIQDLITRIKNPDK